MQILIWITPHFGTKSSGKPALAAEAAKSRNLCDRVFSVRQIGQTPHNSVFSHILADCHTCHLFENPTAGFSGQQCMICEPGQRKRLVEMFMDIVPHNPEPAKGFLAGWAMVFKFIFVF